LKFENHQYYNCEITTNDNQTYKVNANWIHNQNLDNFQGWQCAAGQTRLNIDKDLNVWSGLCENQKLGHALDGFDVFDAPSICNKPRCTGCTDDLLTAKRKI